MILKMGSKGKEVIELQERLGLVADNIFGKITDEAVREFQKANGLEPDGVVGRTTWKALFEAKEGRVVTIVRESSAVDGTRGTAFIDGVEFCKSLELNYYDNLPYYSCIPKGTYQVTYNYSPAFRRNLYLVLDVPNRTGIRIHPASYAGDTRRGYLSDLLGCIALGDKFIDVEEQQLLINSKIWVEKFEKELNYKDFTLEIV